ncbi:hypothetical protein PHBOTO_000464 [Pseudozyma hubeiensis]|nr:hypothetical protein PHBOTO_000464 [Pseudozyma hubeiensis]
MRGPPNAKRHTHRPRQALQKSHILVLLPRPHIHFYLESLTIHLDGAALQLDLLDANPRC